jgi:hypothetical protein
MAGALEPARLAVRLRDDVGLDGSGAVRIENLGNARHPAIRANSAERAVVPTAGRCSKRGFDVREPRVMTTEVRAITTEPFPHGIGHHAG